MTRDDIVEWTRQAGGFDATPEFLARFAALVAAHERELCIKACDGVDLIGADDCIAAIRARGQQ